MSTAPPPKTDRQIIEGALMRLAQALNDPANADKQVQVLGNGLLEVHMAERRRCVELLKEKSEEAAAIARRRDAPREVRNQAALAANAALGLAGEIARPPGPVCAVCRGQRVVASRVQTLVGTPTMVPCPGCARAGATSDAERQTEGPPELAAEQPSEEATD